MKKITLRKGRYAIVDDQDYDRVSKHHWCFTGAPNGSQCRTKIDGKFVALHRFIALAPARRPMRFKNKNPLDCRRRNLLLPRGRYRGVRRSRYHGQHPWEAAYVGWSEGRPVNHYIGSAATEEEAARLYDKFMVTLKGDKALLNFPGEKP